MWTECSTSWNGKEQVKHRRRRRSAARRRSTAPPCSDHVVEADHPVTFAELAEAGGLPGRRPRGCSRRSSAPELLERSGTGEYVGGPLFVLYAARHDRNKQLARLAMPTLEADRRGDRRDGAPRGRQRRPGRATSPRSTRPTCSARATGPTSRSRRTLRARQGAARLGRDRAARRRLERPRPHTAHPPRSRPTWPWPAPAASPPRGRARARADRRRASSYPTGRQGRSRPWASRARRHGSRTTSSSASGALARQTDRGASPHCTRSYRHRLRRARHDTEKRSSRASTTRRWSATRRASSS